MYIAFKTGKYFLNLARGLADITFDQPHGNKPELQKTRLVFKKSFSGESLES